METVAILTAISLGWSIVVQVAPALRGGIFGVLASGVAVLATALFCSAVRDLTVFHGFAASEAAWRLAARIVVLFLGGHWVLSSVVQVVRMAAGGSPFGEPVSVDAGGPAILLFVAGLALAITPVVFVLIAVGTLRRELWATAPSSSVAA